jgi:hypothetical protein
MDFKIYIYFAVPLACMILLVCCSTGLKLDATYNVQLNAITDSITYQHGDTVEIHIELSNNNEERVLLPIGDHSFALSIYDPPKNGIESFYNRFRYHNIRISPSDSVIILEAGTSKLLLLHFVENSLLTGSNDESAESLEYVLDYVRVVKQEDRLIRYMGESEKRIFITTTYR